MLLEEFDKNKEAIINPHIVSLKQKNFPKTAAIFFSNDILQWFKKNKKQNVIGKMLNSNGEYPVYEIEYEGVRIAVAQAFVGAPSCVASIEDLIAMGVENIIMAGSCGRLIDSLKHFQIIVPTSALRDEGTSYHYAPPSDEVELDPKCVAVVTKALTEFGIDFVTGKTWTTDGLYRETKDKVARRIEQGAIVVDMECSAVATMTKFRNVKFAQILYGADTLLGEYDPELLKNIDGKKELSLVRICLKCASDLYKAKL